MLPIAHLFFSKVGLYVTKIFECLKIASKFLRLTRRKTKCRQLDVWRLGVISCKSWTLKNAGIARRPWHGSSEPKLRRLANRESL